VYQNGIAKQTVSDFKSNKEIFKQHTIIFALSNGGDISGKKTLKKIYDEKLGKAV
jgi:predicted transcriptional regulator